MTAPRRDETTMLSEKEVEKAWDDVREGYEALSSAHQPMRAQLIRFARAIERAVVSACQKNATVFLTDARGGEPSEVEKREAWFTGWPEDKDLSWAEVVLRFPRSSKVLDAGIALGRRHAVSPEALREAKREAYVRGWFAWHDGEDGVTASGAVNATYPSDPTIPEREINGWVAERLRETLAPVPPAPGAPDRRKVGEVCGLPVYADGDVPPGIVVVEQAGAVVASFRLDASRFALSPSPAPPAGSGEPVYDSAKARDTQEWAHGFASEYGLSDERAKEVATDVARKFYKNQNLAPLEEGALCVKAGYDLAMFRIASLSSAPQDAAAVREKERIAFDKGWVACCKAYSMPVAMDIDIACDREYPAPPAAPRSVTLGDGSVVTVRGETLYRDLGWNYKQAAFANWRNILRDDDTGADFDAVKSLASTRAGTK